VGTAARPVSRHLHVWLHWPAQGGTGICVAAPFRISHRIRPCADPWVGGKDHHLSQKPSSERVSGLRHHSLHRQPLAPLWGVYEDAAWTFVLCTAGLSACCLLESELVVFWSLSNMESQRVNEQSVGIRETWSNANPFKCVFRSSTCSQARHVLRCHIRRGP
jgi:hypothetical protein